MIISQSQMLREAIRAFHQPVMRVVQEIGCAVNGEFIAALAAEEASKGQRVLLPELIVFR